MMKKTTLLFCFLTLLTAFAKAQYGNEWIVPSQTYYKLQTAQDGMYALPYSKVSNIVGVAAANLQLWHRGVEQKILIKDANGTFDSGDSIIFYGKRNDGTLDAKLYTPSSSQPHNYFNLYNDTTAYFLTWSAIPSTKRMSIDPTNTIVPIDIFHLEQALKVYTDDYSRGMEYGEAYQTYGDKGETWCGSPFRLGQFTENISLSNVHNASGVFTVEVMIVGRNNAYSRPVTITIDDLTSGTQIVDTFPIFDTHDKSLFVNSYSSSLLKSSNISISITPLTTLPVPNLISIAYIKVNYPQSITMGGATTKVFSPANSAVQSYDSIQWASPSLPVVFDITDKNNLQLLNKTFNGTDLVVFVPSGTKEYTVIQSDAYLSVPTVKTVNMSPYDTLQNYLILTHRKLWPEAQQYATYRASVAGGKHDTLMIDVEKLYNQFSYGEFSALGIMNFCRYQTDYNKHVKNLFIIGKGLDHNFWGVPGGYYRLNPSSHTNNPDPLLRKENLIPTAGSPPSDILYVMKNVSGFYKPSMAVGRLSAKTGSTVINYLNKVKEYEALDSNLLWRKQLIHLSGGANPGQIQQFHQYVEGYRTIVENSLYHGKVIKTYTKDLNTGAVDNAQITNDVNGGLNTVTFFGHSAHNVTELDIGMVSQDIFGYKNKGKYPMLIINGCESAAVYLDYSLAEDWLNTPDRGAILVMGVSDIGYTSPLDNYCSAMYRGLFDTDSLRNKPAGKVMKDLLNTNTSIDYQTAMQMNLHGDPQIRIYSPVLPDYEISGDDVNPVIKDQPALKCFIKSFDAKEITAVTDSFMIGIPIKNFGTFKDTTFSIKVTRTVNGKEIVFPEVFYDAIGFVDTVFFVIRDNNKGTYNGLNKFTIEVNLNESYGFKEMRKDNNTAVLNYFVSKAAVTCLFPKEFSIVHDQPVTFVAQSDNLLIKQREYIFQLDTNYLFPKNSPSKIADTITSGSLVKWKPPVNAQNNNLFSNNSKDSTVYYWRVRFKDIPAGDDTSWATSSFIYIKNSPDGWSQSEAPQFEKDIQTKVYLDLADSTWKFSGSSVKVKLDIFGDGDGSDPVDMANFKVGDNNLIFPGYQYEPCDVARQSSISQSLKVNGIFAMTLNKNTLEYNLIPGFAGYPYTCGRWPKTVINRFYTSYPGWQTIMENWLNAIPTGDYLILGTSGNANFDSWPPSLKAALANFGALQIAQLNDHEPYLLVAQKGATAPITEKHSENVNASLSLDSIITGTYNNGYVKSTRIGPSTQWGTFYQRVYASGQDQYAFKILGEKLNGTIDTLAVNFTFAKNADGIDTLDLQPQIDAKVYPYIKLLCMVYDSSASLDPPQLDRWQVIYHKSPEGSMNPFAAGLNNYDKIDPKQEGAKVCIPYDFDNIGDLAFDDSLMVHITAKGESGVLIKDTTFIVHKDSLNPGKSAQFNYCLNTKGLSGKVTMRTFVNPYTQPEEYYTNNVLETYFEVIKDKIPPVIDVTFDGVHILDGDMVSPSPVITITLNDNNKHLVIKDTSDIEVFFKKPGGSIKTINYTHKDIVNFGQVEGGSNTFTVTFHPKNLPDGDYTIIVRGKDVNGNTSGQLYSVTFHVENASTISNFYPYPNPFSTSTKFVFTLSGRYIPDDLKIQIMTVTGKVVREITKEELGHIHIGNNKSEYAWNGTDEFGDKLANGVYLYRVIIKNKGDNFEHRDTAGDKAFKKDFGKIYILR